MLEIQNKNNFVKNSIYDYNSFLIEINFKSLFKKSQIFTLNKIKEKYFKNLYFSKFDYSFKLGQYILSEKNGKVLVLDKNFNIINKFGQSTILTYSVNLIDLSNFNHACDDSLIFSLLSNSSLVQYNRITNITEVLNKSKISNFLTKSQSLLFDEERMILFRNESNEFFIYDIESKMMIFKSVLSSEYIYLVGNSSNFLNKNLHLIK